MFRSCMYTLSSILLIFLYFKTFFYKISQVQNSAVFLFQTRPADRPGRPAPAQDVHILCMSAGRPPGSTDCLQVALGFSGSTVRSTAIRNLCFFLEDGRPERSTRAQRLLPARRTVDRTGRPPGLQSSNGSFLFGAILKSVFRTVFWQNFSEFLEIFSRSNKLKINCF